MKNIVGGIIVLLIVVFTIIGVMWLDNYVGYSIAKSNCDMIGGNLTYVGQSRNDLFRIDTWKCSKGEAWAIITHNQRCYVNDEEINCSEMI